MAFTTGSRLFGTGSKAWLKRHISDNFVKQASKEDLRSRSAFKLIEIQDKHKFIKPKDFVVDLGAAPGGWSVSIEKLLKPSLGGMLCAIDLLSMEPIPNTHFIRGDFNDDSVKAQLLAYSGGRQIDVIVSDMLQNTSGVKSDDHFRSINLCLNALYFSETNVVEGGSFLCKFLRGSDDNELINASKEVFQDVKIIKPKASRSESNEIYLLATKKKKKV